jgi:hypothetical protein
VSRRQPGPSRLLSVTQAPSTGRLCDVHVRARSWVLAFADTAHVRAAFPAHRQVAGQMAHLPDLRLFCFPTALQTTAGNTSHARRRPRRTSEPKWLV